MTEEDNFKGNEQKAIRLVTSLFILMLVLISSSLLIQTIAPNIFSLHPPPKSSTNKPIETDVDEIRDGIHLRTGLIDAEGLMTVVNNCTSCHSSKIIIQNRMNEERWNSTIKWMQETQNLWDLGENQKIIVNYLVTNYPIEDKGRRENLSNIEWYELEN